MRDVQLSLVDLHFALSEIHLDLLRRAQAEASDNDWTDVQTPSHSLKLADDTISSSGNGDTVVGDSALVYVQIDSSVSGFEFDEMNDNSMSASLKGIMDSRQEELDAHVEFDLEPSEPLSNTEESNLAFADVPFYISVANDKIELQDNNVMVTGDFATLGITYSEDGSANDIRPLSKYTESISILRVKPAVCK